MLFAVVAASPTVLNQEHTLTVINQWISNNKMNNGFTITTSELVNKTISTNFKQITKTWIFTQLVNKTHYHVQYLLQKSTAELGNKHKQVIKTLKEITLRLELNSPCKRLAEESTNWNISGIHWAWWVPLKKLHVHKPTSNSPSDSSLPVSVELVSQTATVVLDFLFKGHFRWLMCLCNVDPHLHLLLAFPLPFLFAHRQHTIG